MRAPRATPAQRSPFRHVGGVALILLAAAHFVSEAVTEQSTSMRREVLALDRTTGSIVWSAPCISTPKGAMHFTNTAATPTMTTDGSHLYAHFGDSGTFCLDMDGKIVWSRTAPEPSYHWGPGSSPILWNDLVIVSYDSDYKNYARAYDKRTGEQVWEVDRPLSEGTDHWDGYSTPIVVEIDGVPQLIHYSTLMARGYNPQSGKELWSLPVKGIQPCVSPILADDLLILPCGAHTAVHIAGVRLHHEGDTWRPEVLWNETKMVPNLSCPVAYRGKLYSVTGNGVAVCRDVQTGAEVWKKRLDGEYWSGVMACNGHIYFTNLAGLTTVIAADGATEPTVVAENDLGERFVASMAIVDGELFLRGDVHLYCIASP